jgi:hypothetical protein
VIVGYVIGYDPGGNGRHGLAALRIEERGGRWEPLDLFVTTGGSLQDVVRWVDTVCRNTRIVAAGVDTLTEWNSGHSGYRPADVWLRENYPELAPSVVAPNSMAGSMAINGGAFLLSMADRFGADSTKVTEAHPKVCYRALTGAPKADWENEPADRQRMVDWLIGELGVGSPNELCVKDDHRFDAATAALAALRGLNGDWTLDLHALPDKDYSRRIQFCGPTHYWWPNPPAQA